MKTFLHFIFTICCLLFTEFAAAQIVLSGAYINITNGATLVVTNTATTAITRNSGAIITEGQNNTLKWNMGTATGTYTVPLGYGTNYIPVTFTKSAGTGSGYFSFSTYHTGWQNSASLPSDVANVNFGGTDYSASTIDRFWKIEAAGYSAKPALTNLSFTYIDAEHSASGNSIFENELGIQRWNSTYNDWGDFIPGVTINTTTNVVTVATVSAANLFKWWTLPSISNGHFLPVELTAFNGSCDDGNKIFNWTTASEMNSASFTLESSANGYEWHFVKIIPAAGNSNRVINYSVTDENSTNEYYRLKQTDLDGSNHFSDIIRLACENNSPLAVLEIFPNPTTGTFNLRNAPQGASLDILDPIGQVVHSETISNSETSIHLDGLSKGVYLVMLRDGQTSSAHKLVLQ